MCVTEVNDTFGEGASPEKELVDRPKKKITSSFCRENPFRLDILSSSNGESGSKEPLKDLSTSLKTYIDKAHCFETNTKAHMKKVKNIVG